MVRMPKCVPGRDGLALREANAMRPSGMPNMQAFITTNIMSRLQQYPNDGTILLVMIEAPALCCQTGQVLKPVASQNRRSSGLEWQ